MNTLWLWFSTGLEHITDLNGYDHILFVSLLVFAYPFREWKKILLLVSGFTLGHSISLAMSVTGVFRLPQGIVEFLIAGSIFISAVYQMVRYKKTETQSSIGFIFCMVTFFGLIHGLGFSYLLRSMLGAGQSVILPLLYFNLGLEAGQLIIVLIVILFSLFLTALLKCPFQIYKLIVICLTGLIALKMCVERFSELV